MRVDAKKYLSHPVLRTAMSLYGMQMAEYVLPMVTIPYLARVLQPAGWGLVVYAQNFTTWLVLLLEYGFSFSATREIARKRADTSRHSEIAGGVFGANILLLIPVILITIVARFTVPVFEEHPLYLWLAFATAMQGTKPFWYFLGVEAMQAPAMLNVIGRLIAAVGIFWLVKGPQHGWIVLTLQAVTGFVIAIVMTKMLYSRVDFSLPTLASSIGALKRGWTIFMSRSAVSLYTMANTLILGFFVDSEKVAYFGGAERVVLVVLGLLTPLGQALYPRMSHLAVNDRGRANTAIRLGLLVFGSLALLMGLALIVAAPLVVRILLGPKYQPAVNIMRIAAISIPFVGISNILGMQWMLPFGMDRQFNRIAIGAAIVNTILALSLTPRFGPIGTAFSVVGSQLFVAVSMSIAFIRAERSQAAAVVHEVAAE